MKKKSFKRFAQASVIIMIPVFVAGCSATSSTQEGLGWTHQTPMGATAGEMPVFDMTAGKSYEVDAPPANDSDTTKAELAELHEMAKNRTAEDIELINHWAGGIVSPNTHWFAVTEEMLKKYNVGPEATRVHAIVSSAIYTATTAVFDEKYTYLRPRPTDLDPTLQLPEGFKVPPHPAYPSGHSASSEAASTVLSYMFPNERETFAKMSDDAGMSRLKAGIHYRSDMEAGNKLGREVANDLIKQLQDEEKPLQFTEVSHGPAGH